MAKAFNRVAITPVGSSSSKPGKNQLAAVVPPAATAQNSVPETAQVKAKTAKRRLRRLSVGAMVVGDEESEQVETKGMNTNEDQKVSEQDSARDVGAGSTEEGSPSETKATEQKEQAEVVSAEHEEARTVETYMTTALKGLWSGDHGATQAALEAAAATESENLELQRWAKRAQNIVEQQLAHVDHKCAISSFQYTDHIGFVVNNISQDLHIF